MRVVDIVEGTIVDGPGLRTSVYLAGCEHRCPGCHNPSTWDFDAGHEMSEDELVKAVVDSGLNVTLTGGDPVYSCPEVTGVARRLKEVGLNVWLYTGFTIEQLLEMAPARELLRWVDVVVDGPFVEALRDTELRFRGSSNQRVIDVAASLRQGVAVTCPDV